MGSVTERSRRWTRNPLGSARRGSNPLGVVCIEQQQHCCMYMRSLLMPSSTAVRLSEADTDWISLQGPNVNTTA